MSSPWPLTRPDDRGANKMDVGMSERRPAALPQPGAMLDGRYRITRALASGAMGAVYEAIDERDQSAVAVKVLKPDYHSDPSIRRRFRRESSILAAIAHPGVVRTLDVGTDESDRSYTVMELLRGETLEALLLRERALAPLALGAIVRGIADALGAVHSHGVIHGDLKPANVFLLATPAGATQVKLVDFGLSKIEGLERLTRTGELTGTPAYMAPELLTGAGELDSRIDVYALGVCAYQSLAGRLPFQLNKHPGALMFDIVMGKGIPLSEARPELSPLVVASVARAMAPKREERWQDAPSFAADLERAIRD